jgi:hypothetical protein
MQADVSLGLTPVQVPLSALARYLPSTKGRPRRLQRPASAGFRFARRPLRHKGATFLQGVEWRPGDEEEKNHGLETEPGKHIVIVPSRARDYNPNITTSRSRKWDAALFAISAHSCAMEIGEKACASIITAKEILVQKIDIRKLRNFKKTILSQV